MHDAMKDVLKRLTAVYGATGREEVVSKAIRAMIMPYVDEMREDALGNLIAVKHGRGKRVMLAAHMDQIGFVVTDIDERGFLRVSNVGGIRMTASLNRRVVFENGMSGVLSYEIEDNNLADNAITKLFIDIGATSREEAEKRVLRGDVAVYAPDVFEVGENCLAGPAMDNRVGCAVLVEALRLLGGCDENEIVCVFTSQEEVGLRGAKAAAYDIAPDLGIALDVTPSGDTPKGIKLPMKLGGGVAVKIMDSSLICHPGVVRMLEEAAAREGIAHQREVLYGGGTDGGAIQQTRGGTPTGVLSIPCRYVHSATEMVSLDDCVCGAQLLARVLAGPIEL